VTKWTPDQVIALVVVIIAAVLLGVGIDSEVKSVLAMAAAWAFGRTVSNLRSQ